VHIDIKWVAGMKTILACTKCKEAFYPTIYDSYPVYDLNGESKSFIEKDNDDKAQFLDLHKDHRITQLQVVDDSFCSQYSYCDIVREDYFISTTYTLSRWRKNINEPLRYQIIDAHIEFGKPVIQVQSDELKRQMLAEPSKLKLNERKS